MGSRREWCSGCGLQLLVPTDATAVRCVVCQAITRFPYPPPPAAPFVYGGSSYCSRPPPPLSPLASAFGRKRAVLCGINYYGKPYRLKGSINDVKCMNYFLLNKMGFPPDSVLLLSEEETNPLKTPTKRNIRLALKWLVEGCQAGDSLVFHFSGHGTTEPDYDDDEVDGNDEALCPLDYETEGFIIDDEINGTIVRPLPYGAKLHGIIDACHSGTVLDLPFVCRMNREGYYIWEDQTPREIYKGTSGGLAVCFSACDDHQLSEDTTAFTGSKVMTGAMTYNFIQAVQNEPGLTYGRLLNCMRNAIRESKSSGGLRLNGPIASILNKLVFTSNNSSGEPQLSSSEKFDIYSTKFIL
ncbi:metacaspase-1 isoform X2 [Carica papaya]|uniref:metacaspase-1 isoform X2 n=1 Tax=Carica papaya TaxID=3649 RepID=UPI000B8CC2BA|nr:metacaspase-1 isoform X2 [Carica papaya]